VLRLKGQGGEGFNGGDRGDALIEVKNPAARLLPPRGQRHQLDLPVTLSEAVLGAKISVPTPGGPVAMSIPAHSDSGKRMRLRGKGVAAHAGKDAGDLYVTLRVVIGKPTPELEEFLRAKAPDAAPDPRASMLPESEA